MTEKIAIVDLEDNILGVISRTDLDKKTQIYRTVGSFVVFDDGTILIQRRAFSKKTHAGKWDISSSAGYVRAGEDYISAAIRETEEEVGLRLSNPVFVQKILSENTCGGHKFLTNFVFFAPNEMKNEVKIHQSEVAEFRFLTLDEICEDFKMNHEDYTYYAEKAIEVLNNFLKEIR